MKSIDSIIKETVIDILTKMFLGKLVIKKKMKHIILKQIVKKNTKKQKDVMVIL